MPAKASCATARTENQAAPAAVRFAEAFRFWLKLGFISFGGPAGVILNLAMFFAHHMLWPQDFGAF